LVPLLDPYQSVDGVRLVFARERCPIQNTIVDDLPSALLRSVGTNSFERKVQVCQNTHV